MMHLSQILVWIAVGAFLAIVAGMAASGVRNIRRRFESRNQPPKSPPFSIEKAFNQQNDFVKSELKQQGENAALDRDMRAEKVETELKKQQEVVKTALNEQQESVKQDLDAQSEVIQKALTKYQSATKTDLVKETEIVKSALAETVKNRPAESSNTTSDITTGE